LQVTFYGMSSAKHFSIFVRNSKFTTAKMIFGEKASCLILVITVNTL